MTIYFNADFNYYVANITEHLVVPEYIKSVEISLSNEFEDITLNEANERAKKNVDLELLANYEMAADASTIVITFIDGNWIEMWNSEWGGMNFSFEVKEN